MDDATSKGFGLPSGRDLSRLSKPGGRKISGGPNDDIGNNAEHFIALASDIDHTPRISGLTRASRILVIKIVNDRGGRP